MLCLCVATFGSSTCGPLPVGAWISFYILNCVVWHRLLTLPSADNWRLLIACVISTCEIKVNLYQPVTWLNKHNLLLFCCFVHSFHFISFSIRFDSFRFASFFVNNSIHQAKVSFCHRISFRSVLFSLTETPLRAVLLLSWKGIFGVNC